MDLPLTLQMEIDISAAAHKREIADGFAKLRAELLPPLSQSQLLMNNLYGALVGQAGAGLAASQEGLNWTQMPNALAAANSANPYCNQYFGPANGVLASLGFR